MAWSPCERCSICAPQHSSASDAEHLQLPVGTPVMATVRQGFLADDRPIELTRSIYRADRYDFVAEMRRGPGGVA